MISILVVDDSATSRLLFRAYLPSDAQVELHEAADGQAALAKAEEVRPDVTVLDYNMPDHNGVEIARQLRARGSDTKFVLLTANVQPSILQAAEALGFMTVVEKPINREKIANLIQATESWK